MNVFRSDPDDDVSVLARGNGFDEALFVGPGGVVSKGSITNIGFIHGDAIVWPDAPPKLPQVPKNEDAEAGIGWMG